VRAISQPSRVVSQVDQLTGLGHPSLQGGAPG